MAGEMEHLESEIETLPTAYGVVIAFITGLVGYVLWVSFHFFFFLLFTHVLYLPKKETPP